jgi:hypothetical protein
MKSALATTDGVPTAWPEEIAPRDSARLNWPGLTLHSKTARGTDTLSVRTKGCATGKPLLASVSLATKARRVAVSRVQTIAQVTELVNS